MTRKLTITYDRRDALFQIVSDTEHGGRYAYRCTYGTARDMICEFIEPLAERQDEQVHRVAMLAPLMDGNLTSITLEAP